MRGTRPNLCWCTWIEDSNRVEIRRSLGKHLKVGHDLVFRFLDLDQLAKLGGLARFPLRMISVCGSNTLTVFPGNFVSPAKIRIRVCLTTCRTRPTLVFDLATGPSSPATKTPCFSAHPAPASHLAQAIGQAAIQQGYRVLYRETHAL